MTLAGHSLLHLPQPTQRDVSTLANMPLHTSIADSGQTLTQQPQATHASSSTQALRFFCFASRTGQSSLELVLNNISQSPSAFRDNITIQHSVRRRQESAGGFWRINGIRAAFRPLSYKRSAFISAQTLIVC